MSPTIAALLLSLCASIFPPQEAELLFAGDAMMHKSQLDAAREASRRAGDDKGYDFSEYFTAVKEQISKADYAVVNLETPIGGGSYTGYPCFCAPEAFAGALADAGFDLMLTANNHTLDRRDRGLRRTCDILTSAGYDHVGTYRNSSQRDSILPLIRDIKGFKVAFLNYTYGTNGITVQGDVVVDYIDRDLMRSDIAAARRAGAELVCVAVHWGVEYQLHPHSTQKSLADFLIKSGADMVIGGHPHVVQPMEMRTDSLGRNRLVVYSLGNFISGMKTRDTRGGAMLNVRLSRDSLGHAQVKAADYSLVFTVPAAGRRNFHLVYADSCSDPSMASHARAFATTAHSLFRTHNKNIPHRTPAK